MRQYLGKKHREQRPEPKELRLHTDYSNYLGVVILLSAGLALLVVAIGMLSKDETLHQEDFLKSGVLWLGGLFLLNLGLKLIYSLGDYIDIRKEGIELRLSKSVWCWEVPRKAFFAWKEIEGYYVNSGSLCIKIKGETKARRYDLTYLWTGFSLRGTIVEKALFPYLGQQDTTLRRWI